MNTLSKEITATFFEDTDGYNKLVTRWKELTNDKEARKSLDSTKHLNSSEHLLYAILRGKDWRKGFTSCTNKVKLANGQSPRMGLNTAWGGLRSEHYNNHFLKLFEGIITLDGLNAARELFNANVNLYGKGDAYRNDEELELYREHMAKYNRKAVA